MVLTSELDLMTIIKTLEPTSLGMCLEDDDCFSVFSLLGDGVNEKEQLVEIQKELGHAESVIDPISGGGRSG